MLKAKLLQRIAARLFRWAPPFLALFPVAAAALTTAGSAIENSFTATYRGAAGPATITSNRTKITVKDLSDPAIVPPRTGSTPAGKPVDFHHVITNRGNFSDSFLLQANAVSASLPAGGAFRLQLFQADGETPLSLGDGGAAQTPSVPPGGSVEVVLRVTPSPGPGSA